MTKLEMVLEQYPDEELLSADGFENAVMGVYYERENGVYKLVYSRARCIQILMQRDGMTYEEAEEFFDFNVEGAYMGEKTPIYVDDEMFVEI
jgi:hypothetical protein